MVDRQKPAVLIIRDGWGQNPDSAMDQYNAIVQANTPFADSLFEDWPTTLIGTSGLQVGLPDNTMGNSEVGHQNIGAGRIVPQELVRLNQAIDDGLFASNQVLASAFKRGCQGHAVHIVGLVSDGKVHSDINHLFALLDAAPKECKIFIHVITDGRDCSPTTGVGFVKLLEEKVSGSNATIASVMGRYYAMDRDNRWERVAAAWDVMTGKCENRQPPNVSLCAMDVVREYYESPTETQMSGDEFVVPTQIVDAENVPVGLVKDGDALIFFNYRGDRPRELSRAFVLEDDT